MNVSFYDFKSLHDQDFKKQYLERVSSILEENSYIEGKDNFAFEKQFAQLQQSSFCSLVANGTDALEIALQAQGVQVGDLVGVPALSFYASAEAIINIGASPVFIDIDPDSGLLCPRALKKTLETHELKAVMPVHLYGHPCAMQEIEALCSPLNIPIVEDGAQAQGATYLDNGKPVGSRQNLSTFSFYPTKNLGALGDAGAIMGSSEELMQKVVMIRNHGRSPQGHALIGRNSRCDHFQAAALLLKLEKLAAQNQVRKSLAKRYFEKLAPLPLRLSPETFLEHSSWHLFPIRCQDASERKELMSFLKERQIGTALFYEKALTEEMPLQEFPGDVTVAPEFNQQVLCLPLNPFLSLEQLEYVERSITQFYG